MPAVIFVHGTGVRQPAYDSTLSVIKERLANLPAWECVPCFWGKLGCSLRASGVSIPAYPTTRGLGFGGALSDTDDVNTALWRVLYDNPTFELAQLPQGDPVRFVPRSGLRSTVADLLADGNRNAVIARLASEISLGEVWFEAKNTVANSRPFQNAVNGASEERSELLKSIARSWVATAIVLKRDSVESAEDLPTGTERDSLVDAILTEWNAHERGLPRWVVQPTKMAAAFAMGTDFVQRRRGRFSEKHHLEVGDVLLYMARGDEIRTFIRETAQRLAPPVALLAHSLGGIAGFELVASGELAGIDALITVGTQAPLLYELDVLRRFRYGQKFPGDCRWLNIFDIRDFLSYKAKGLFPEDAHVTDKEVNSHQPFPESHGAYWRNPEVWDAIISVLKRLE